MKSILLAAVLALPLVGSTPAFAADLVGQGEFGGYRGPGVVAGPLTVYDFEPGTYVRAWFEPPWANRRYFPSGTQAPVLGRDEVLDNRDSEAPQIFYRSWSNGPALRDTMIADPDSAPVPQK